MRRWTAVLLLAVQASVVHGQVYDAIAAALRAARDRGFVPLAAQKSVTDLKGFPISKSREGSLPPPVRGGDQENLLQVVHTETFDRTGDDVTLTGGIELIYHGYHIYADKADGNLAREIFNFNGNVRMIGESAIINGDSLMVEFKTRFYRATKYDADIKPAISQGLLLDDVYLKAQKSEGTKREVKILDASATTCSYKEPHYEILAARATIRPYRRAIFHDVDLIILHRKVLHLPFLSVPLNEPNYNYVPEVGRSTLEGYFVKARYGIPLRNDVNNLDARIDYFSKLGQALGGDYRYGRRDQNTLSVYGLSGGPHSFEVASHHLQDLGRLTVSLDNSYQNHNYQTDPNSISLTSRAILT